MIDETTPRLWNINITRFLVHVPLFYFFFAILDGLNVWIKLLPIISILYVARSIRLDA